ncbi:MAG: TonB-dependent receptor [Rhodothermales bacterium]
MHAPIASWLTKRTLIVLLLLAWIGGFAPLVQAQQQYTEVSVREVIAQVQASTDYRFLYRDALVAGKRVSFSAVDGNVLTSFDAALRQHNLQLHIDEGRRQVLLTETPEPERPAYLNGTVLDDETGMRLPSATVTWTLGDQLRGVVANSAGVFQVPLDAYRLQGDALTLTVSFIGYQSQQVRLALTELPPSLPVRLRPEAVHGQEVIVTSSALATNVDTLWQYLLEPGAVATVGEQSVVRSLQMLPAVSVSPGLSQGLNVRGSNADGFQILLDGIPIYSQSHLYGLVDAFNTDALQTVGFYYGITPAHFQGPPGGTLSFKTRTGSQTMPRLALGLSNTTIRGTAEGPLLDGRGSWLVSGRRSYMDAVDWFNNVALIEQGLGIGRENDGPTFNLPTRLQERVDASQGTADASFYDLHAKVYVEQPSGGRWSLSTYFGGDDALQQSERPVVLGQQVTGEEQQRPELTALSTSSRWGNEAGSLQHQVGIGSAAFLHSTLALSNYRSRYARDDYEYQVPRRRQQNPGDESQQSAFAYLDFFGYENTMRDLKLAQQVDVGLSGGTWSAGYEFRDLSIRYAEDSRFRTEAFDETVPVQQFDVFSQVDLSRGAWTLQSGLRTHYYSAGSFFRFSPRMNVRWAATPEVALGAGYSHNYQFVHRLYLSSIDRTEGADIWVPSTEAQAPGSVQHVHAGLYLSPSSVVSLQVEAYDKRYSNLRQHELSVSRRLPDQDGSFLLRPWIFDMDGHARGIEAMLQVAYGPARWSTSYTLSRMDLSHPRIENGEPFRADWDRRHQVTSTVEVELGAGIQAQTTLLYATGTPNLAFGVPTFPDEPEQLSDYTRIDAGLQYDMSLPSARLSASLTFFNALDWKNTWYRGYYQLIRVDENRRLVAAPGQLANYFDLGFQPSFDLSLTF